MPLTVAMLVGVYVFNNGQIKMNKLNTGWIKLHRQLLEWEWYDDPNTFRVFIHLCLKANHVEKKWKGIDIKKGQIVSGQDKIASELGISRQNVRTALSNLQLTNDITINSGTKGTVIQLVNYSKYQSLTSKLTNDQPTDQPQINQRSTNGLTTTKEEKNDNNGEEEKKFDFKKSLIEYGADQKLAEEWLKVRKAKKGVNTETALNGFIKKVEKSDRHVNEILTICVENSWSGFNTEWLSNITSKNNQYEKRTNTGQSRAEALINWGKGNHS